VSQEAVEIVRGLYADLTHGDLAAAEARLGANVEWDTTVRGSDGGVVYGAKGVISATREWLDAWEDVGLEVRKIRDIGDLIGAHLRQHARGKSSGIEGDVDAFASFRVSGEKIVGYREYSTWSETVQAVGLKE
jgi:hypothetical protein